jgi:hypothetical protein
MEADPIRRVKELAAGAASESEMWYDVSRQGRRSRDREWK